MNTEPIWIVEAVVRAIHRRQIAEHGGLDGIRDEGILASALERPRNLFAYAESSDIPSLAAAYAFGIARNHPFLDGNKRTALVVSRTFLLLNARDVDATQDDKYRAFFALAEGSLSEEELIAWFQAKVK